MIKLTAWHLSVLNTLEAVNLQLCSDFKAFPQNIQGAE